MAMHDIIKVHVDRLALLSDFLRAAHLGRRWPESPVARAIRRHLITQIEFMLDGEREMLSAVRQCGKHTPKGQPARCGCTDSQCWATDRFIAYWAETDLMDLDPVVSGRRAHESYPDPLFDGDFPVLLPIASAELGNLAELIARIERGLRIAFTIRRVFWNEDALTVFTRAEEERRQSAA